MARVWSSGFELNSTGAAVEFTTQLSTVTIQTGTVRTGTYAVQVAPSAGTAANTIDYNFLVSGSTANVYFRAYLNISALPASTVSIIGLSSSSLSFSTSETIRLTST